MGFHEIGEHKPGFAVIDLVGEGADGTKKLRATAVCVLKQVACQRARDPARASTFRGVPKLQTMVESSGQSGGGTGVRIGTEGPGYIAMIA